MDTRMHYEFVVPGRPIGKQRPRFARSGVIYTPTKTHNYEKRIAAAFSAKYPNHEPIENCIKLTITSYFPAPKSTSKKRLREMEAEQFLFNKRPDIDNVLKSVLDGLSGTAWTDDKLVTDITACKRYSPQPRIVVEIEILEDETL